MKAVIQRVFNASVAVDGQTISSIGKGLMVLIGVDKDDTPAESTSTIKKILNMKLFDDEEGALWQRSVMDIQGEVLCVSQFTLFATFKGTKPDFRNAMSTLPGKEMYTAFMEEIRAAYDTDKIQEGRFGAMMAVSLTNDGPTTILLDSKTTKASSGTSTPEAEIFKKKTEEFNKAKEAKRLEMDRRAEANRLKKEAKDREWAESKTKLQSQTSTPAPDQKSNGVEDVVAETKDLALEDGQESEPI